MSYTLSNAEIIALANETNARMDGDGTGGTDPTGGNDGDYPEGLGDAGKAAIDRMKAERNQAKSDHAALKAEFETFKTQQASRNGQPDNTQNDQANRNGQPDNTQQKPDTKSPDQIRDEVTSTLTAEQNKRVLRSDVRRLASDKLSDPSDALLYLDLSDLTPNTHGDFDESAIGSKLDQLLKDRPYLAKRTVNFQGGADSGNRGNGDAGSAPSQLTRDDLKNMNPLDINKARLEGRLKDVMGGTK